MVYPWRFIEIFFQDGKILVCILRVLAGGAESVQDVVLGFCDFTDGSEELLAVSLSLKLA